VEKNKTIRAVSLRNQLVIADQCNVADSFWVRLKGLMGVKKLEEGTGLFFPKCSSVHTWFMSIPIDLIFLGNEEESRSTDGGVYSVVHVVEQARPWSLLPFGSLRAKHVLEVPAGTVKRSQVQRGDLLCIK